MKGLVIGHFLGVENNRKFWAKLSSLLDHPFDLVLPSTWKSNLINNIYFSRKPETDQSFGEIYPVKTYLDGNGSFYFYRFFILYKILNKKKYDFILMLQETWSLSLLQLNIIKFFTKNRTTPMVLQVAQNLKKTHLAFLHPFERLNTRGVKLFIGCSMEAKEVLRWKGIKQDYEYLPLTLDPIQFSSVPAIQTSKKITVGYIGRLSTEKGLELICQLAETLSKIKNNIEFVCMGSGEWEERLKTHPHIQLRAAIPHEQVQEFYQSCHILVVPSITTAKWKEQFGRVLIEASASGRAVIASNSGEIPNVMKRINMPYLFQENSLEDFKKMLLFTCEQLESGKLESLEESRAIALKLFSHQYNAEKMANKLKTLFSTKSELFHQDL